MQSIMGFEAHQKLFFVAALGISVMGVVLQAPFYCWLIFYTHWAIFSSARHMLRDFFLLWLAPSKANSAVASDLYYQEARADNGGSTWHHDLRARHLKLLSVLLPDLTGFKAIITFLTSYQYDPCFNCLAWTQFSVFEPFLQFQTHFLNFFPKHHFQR